MEQIGEDYQPKPYSRRKNMSIKFKMGVRKRLPKKIRYATVCRKCRQSSSIRDRCISCQIEQAVSWGRPY